MLFKIIYSYLLKQLNILGEFWDQKHDKALSKLIKNI